MKVRVSIEGQRQIVRKLNVLADEVAKLHLEAATLEGAEVIRKAIEDKAPKGESGFLKSHILKEVDPENTRRNKVTVSIGPHKEAFYALFVEFGHALVRGSRKATRKVIGSVPPHPFMRPAFDESKRRVRQTILLALKRRLGL